MRIEDIIRDGYSIDSSLKVRMRENTKRRKLCEADEIGKAERIRAHRKRVLAELRRINLHDQHDKYQADMYEDDDRKHDRHEHGS